MRRLRWRHFVATGQTLIPPRSSRGAPAICPAFQLLEGWNTRPTAAFDNRPRGRGRPAQGKTSVPIESRIVVPVPGRLSIESAPRLRPPDRLGDRQPDAAVLGLGAEKRLGRASQDLGAHAATRVSDRDHQPVSRVDIGRNLDRSPTALAVPRERFATETPAWRRSPPASPGIGGIEPRLSTQSTCATPVLFSDSTASRIS